MHGGFYIVAHVVYVVLLLLALLIFVYTPLSVAGVFLAGILFLLISTLVETNPLNFKTFFRILAFLGLVVIAYFIVGSWMIANAPGGTYSPRTGLETRAWWVDGTYTKFGRYLVWKWVGWVFGLYILAEGLRHTPKILKIG